MYRCGKVQTIRQHVQFFQLEPYNMLMLVPKTLYTCLIHSTSIYQVHTEPIGRLIRTYVITSLTVNHHCYKACRGETNFNKPVMSHGEGRKRNNAAIYLRLWICTSTCPFKTVSHSTVMMRVDYAKLISNERYIMWKNS